MVAGSILAMRHVFFYHTMSSCHRQQPREQGGPLKEMHPIAPQRRPFRPHFMHLFRLVLTRSRGAECRKANQFLAYLALLVGPEALSHPANAQKSLGRGGRTPPCAPPRRRCAAPGLGYAQPKAPKRGLAASPHIEGFNYHSSGYPHPLMCILCVLGPLFFRSPLYRLVLTRSRCASSCPKRTNFGPFGPPDRPKGPLSPSNCAKFAGAEGADPPLRPQKISAFGGR